MRAVLKEKVIDEPTSVQLEKTTDKTEEDHLVILFLNNANKSKFRWPNRK